MLPWKHIFTPKFFVYRRFIYSTSPNVLLVVQIMFVRSASKIPHVILILQKTWSPWAVLLSNWLQLLAYFLLKLLVHIICYLVQIMYVKSLIEIHHFIWIWL